MDMDKEEETRKEVQKQKIINATSVKEAKEIIIVY